MATLYLVVAGSREFRDYALLCRKLDKLTVNYDEVVVISGAAKGADTLGENWAIARGHQLKQFPPDWRRHGKRAGFVRNLEMLNYAQDHDHCAVAAFWDGASRGTHHTIETAKIKGIPLRVIAFNPAGKR